MASSAHVESIHWETKAGHVLASATFENQLVLVFDPVNDSVAMQGAEFICVVTENGQESNGTLQMSPYCKFAVADTTVLTFSWQSKGTS